MTESDRSYMTELFTQSFKTACFSSHEIEADLEIVAFIRILAVITNSNL